jgi:hypothetical protein
MDATHKQHHVSAPGTADVTQVPVHRGGPDGLHFACSAEPGAIPLTFWSNDMNTKQLIAGLLVFAAAGSAFAVTPYPADDHFVSTKTRAEVQAELADARAQGLMNQGDAAYPVLVAEKSTLTRAQVEQQASNTVGNAVYNGN